MAALFTSCFSPLTEHAREARRTGHLIGLSVSSGGGAEAQAEVFAFSASKMPTSGPPVVEGRPKSGRIKARKGNAEEAPVSESEKAAPPKEAQSASASDSSTVPEKTDAARAGGGGGTLEAALQVSSNGHPSTGDASDQAAEPSKRRREVGSAANGDPVPPSTDATDIKPEGNAGSPSQQPSAAECEDGDTVGGGEGANGADEATGVNGGHRGGEDRFDDAAEAGGAEQEAAKPEASENAGGASPKESSGADGSGAHAHESAEQAPSTRGDPAASQHGADATLGVAQGQGKGAAAPFALRDVATEAVDKVSAAAADQPLVAPGKSESRAEGAGSSAGGGEGSPQASAGSLLGKSADGHECLKPADAAAIKSSAVAGWAAGGAPQEKEDAEAQGGIKMEGAAAESKD
ncbi:hypothetical protein T484DRAFT_1793010, partial [Baffinella frigidus]